MKTIIKPLMLLVALLLLYYLFQPKNSGVTVNEMTPNSGFYHFTLQTLDGRAVTLDDYQGKVLIVDVWDTWCPPCKKGIPEFIDLYSSYRDSGLEILGVALGQQGESAVRNFIRNYRINYTNVLATESFLSGVGGVEGIPTTFVIDKNGMAVAKYVGYTPRQTLESAIQKLL